MNPKLLFGIVVLWFLQNSLNAFSEKLYGVWANNQSELVITEQCLLYYQYKNDTFLSTCIFRDAPSLKTFIAEVAFKNRLLSKIVRPIDEDSYLRCKDIQPKNAHSFVWTWKGEPIELELIESIDITKPYEMLFAADTSIGICLQQWMLGTRTVLNIEKELVSCKIGTNQHSFMFDLSEDYTYCRAARIRSNNHGTLFAQNFRIWVKGEEQMAFILPDHLKLCKFVLEINDSLFDSHACFYDKSGIYWSLDTFTTYKITLHGCGQTYLFERPDVHQNLLTEWFRFHKY